GRASSTPRHHSAAAVDRRRCRSPSQSVASTVVECGGPVQLYRRGHTSVESACSSQARPVRAKVVRTSGRTRECPHVTAVYEQDTRNLYLQVFREAAAQRSEDEPRGASRLLP